MSLPEVRFHKLVKTETKYGWFRNKYFPDDYTPGENETVIAEYQVGDRIGGEILYMGQVVGAMIHTHENSTGYLSAGGGRLPIVQAITDREGWNKMIQHELDW